MISPVTKAASGVHSQATAQATSSGWPMRPAWRRLSDDHGGSATSTRLDQLEAEHAQIDRGHLTLYVSLEPCLMCYGRILLAGITRVRYLARDRDGGFALLTTAPGDDVAPYHDRQIIVLPPEQGEDWLALSRPEAELLRPLPKGALQVERDFPPPELF